LKKRELYRQVKGPEAREAVKALIVANAFLETDLEKLRAAVSPGYSRGKSLRVIGRIGMIEAGAADDEAIGRR